MKRKRLESFKTFNSKHNTSTAGLRYRSKSVRTIVALLRSLSDKYTWEKYEPSYLPSYGLNSTNTVLLEGWIWH